MLSKLPLLLYAIPDKSKTIVQYHLAMQTTVYWSGWVKLDAIFNSSYRLNNRHSTVSLTIPNTKLLPVNDLDRERLSKEKCVWNSYIRNFRNIVHNRNSGTCYSTWMQL